MREGPNKSISSRVSDQLSCTFFVKATLSLKCHWALDHESFLRINLNSHGEYKQLTIDRIKYLILYFPDLDQSIFVIVSLFFFTFLLLPSPFIKSHTPHPPNNSTEAAWTTNRDRNKFLVEPCATVIVIIKLFH